MANRRTQVAALMLAISLALGAGAVGWAAAPDPESPEGLVQKQLDELAPVLREEGLREVQSSGMRSMNQDESFTLDVDLPSDGEFTVVGVCDGDCNDLDIRVFAPSGALLSEDTMEDDVPVVEFETEAPGVYRIEVVMYSCTAEPCFFAASLYRKGKIDTFVHWRPRGAKAAG